MKFVIATTFVYKWNASSIFQMPFANHIQFDWLNEDYDMQPKLHKYLHTMQVVI